MNTLQIAAMLKKCAEIDEKTQEHPFKHCIDDSIGDEFGIGISSANVLDIQVYLKEEGKDDRLVWCHCSIHDDDGLVDGCEDVQERLDVLFESIRGKLTEKGDDK